MYMCFMYCMGSDTELYRGVAANTLASRCHPMGKDSASLYANKRKMSFFFFMLSAFKFDANVYLILSAAIRLDECP